MRTVSATWRVLAGQSHRVATSVRVVRDGTFPLTDVPVQSGSVTLDDTGPIKRRLSLTVPLFDAVTNTNWDPGHGPYAPLAAHGQKLHVRTGMVMPDGTTELVSLGWFLITSWSVNEAERTVSVSAECLVRLLQGQRFWRPYKAKEKTYLGALEELAAKRLLVGMGDGATNRNLSWSPVWERERLDALDKLAHAFPGRWAVDDTGVLRLYPAYASVAGVLPALTLRDGHSGVIVHRARSGERGRIQNCVIVTGKQPEQGGGKQPFAAARITDPNSPIYPDGTYGYENRFYASEMLTSQAQAEATAAAMLVRYSESGRAETISLPPDPSIELGDVLLIRTAGSAFKGRVQSATVPLTAEGGAMQLTVSTLPGEPETYREKA